MTKQTGIHRVTPTSQAGRRMIAIARPHDPMSLSKEQREWNAAVDAKKAAKKAPKPVDPNAWAFKNGLESY